MLSEFFQTLLKSYLGHGDEVLDTKSTCDNSQVVSCGVDKTIILWDVSTGIPQRKWRGHAGKGGFNHETFVLLSLFRLEEKLFFCFLCARKKLFFLEKPFFMKVNPVFINQYFVVCAVSKQILFFSN